MTRYCQHKTRYRCQIEENECTDLVEMKGTRSRRMTPISAQRNPAIRVQWILIFRLNNNKLSEKITKMVEQHFESRFNISLFCFMDNFTFSKLYLLVWLRPMFMPLVPPYVGVTGVQLTTDHGKQVAGHTGPLNLIWATIRATKTITTSNTSNQFQ